MVFQDRRGGHRRFKTMHGVCGEHPPERPACFLVPLTVVGNPVKKLLNGKRCSISLNDPPFCGGEGGPRRGHGVEQTRPRRCRAASAASEYR